MAVLVTGAAGFIGSHVTDRLLAQGQDVVGLDVFDDFYDPAVKERNLAAARDYRGFTEVRGDIRDADFVDSLPDVEAVIHLAARAGVRPSIAEPTLYTDVNVLGTSRLLTFVRKRGIRSFVFASSSSVYGNNERVPFSEEDSVDRPISPYAATKKSGELLCHAASHLDGIRSICLRFFTVYGPRQRPDLAIHKFARLMSEGRAIPVFGDGSTERDYTYIDDILDGVDGALAWVRDGGGSYEIVNLGESRTVSLRQMIATLADVMGVEPIIERLPLQPGDVLRTHADVSKAERLFGYRPSTEFGDGVRRFIDWFEQSSEERYEFGGTAHGG